MTLDIVERLIEALNNSKIGYCHWKSNLALAHALSGETDIDLFVERRSLSQALSILMGLGFKPAIVERGPRMPGISHFYGFDPYLGQLIHVHLFSRVLTGESLIKGHLFPFEGMLRDHLDQMGQVKVTSKSAELVLFVLRVYIKYGSLLDMIRLLNKSREIEAELRWLQAGSDLSEALSLLRTFCPTMDQELFVKGINTLGVESPLSARIRVARQIRRRLDIYARYTSIGRGLAYLQLVWGRMKRSLHGNQKDKKLCAGGAVIAFVGPDASGKSTLVSECGNWLGEAFAIKSVHAGRPPSSWVTAPINVILVLVRKVLLGLRGGRPADHRSSIDPTQGQTDAKGLSSLIYALRAVVLAYDRRQLLIRARRWAANGEIVICDRYPSETIGAMDSPRLQENTTGRSLSAGRRASAQGGMVARVYNWLAGIEGRLYKQIPPPDIVLQLKVSLETAMARNRKRDAHKEQDADIAARHRQSGGWHLSGTQYVYDIDANQSLAETILSAKKVIWEWI